MSNKEMALNLLNSFDESQLANIVTMLKTAKSIADEAADDAFCEKMYQNYLNNPDPHKHDTVSFDEALKECGLTYEDLQN